MGITAKKQQSIAERRNISGSLEKSLRLFVWQWYSLHPMLKMKKRNNTKIAVINVPGRLVYTPEVGSEFI